MTQEHHDATGALAPSTSSTPPARTYDPRPEPIEAEDIDDVEAPHPAPPAEEVLPTARSPFETVADPQETAAVSRTPVQMLGATAAAYAALSAGGAPTPLGGLPLVAGKGDRGIGDAGESPFAHVGPAFQPRFAPVTVAPDARVTPAVGAASPTRRAGRPLPRAGEEGVGREDDAPAATGAPGEAVGAGESTLYRPRVAPGEADPGADALAHGDGDAPGAPGPDAGPAESREPGRAWPLIVVGLLILGAIGFALSWLLSRPEAIELPAQTVVAAPVEETPAVEPIALDDPTPFLAAMPTVAGTWALTAVATADPLTDDALPGRVAEVHTLTYEDGSHAVTLEARQLYSEEDALAALRAAAGQDAEIVDATVADTVVGSRTERSSGEQTRIMWTHGSAYFEAVGPHESVTELVETLGL